MNQTKSPSLNALRVFESVARLKSFKKAAIELGVTQSAVSRQLSALEAQIGLPLIQRDNKVQALTQAGQNLAPELSQIFQRLNFVVAQTVNQSKRQRAKIRVGISLELYKFWLAPALDEFKQLYPHIELSFIQTEEYLNTSNQSRELSKLQQSELDILLIYGHLKATGIVKYKLLESQLLAFSNRTVSLKDMKAFITIQNQPKQIAQAIKSLKLESGFNTNSSYMAATLLQEQSTQDLARFALLSSLYKPHLPLKQTADCTDLKLKPIKLTAYIRHENEHDLTLVAFIQWLEYYAQRFKNSPNH